jgi:hypothetical protein
VQRIAGRESYLTPVATPAGHAVDDQPTVISSRDVASWTGSTAPETDNRTCDETTSITDTPDTDIGLGFRVREPHQNGRKPGTWQNLAASPGSANIDLRLDPLVTTDESLDRSSRKPVAESSNQASEEGRSISIGPAVSSRQLETGPLDRSERGTDEPPPYFYPTNDSIWLGRILLIY